MSRNVLWKDECMVYPYFMYIHVVKKPKIFTNALADWALDDDDDDDGVGLPVVLNKINNISCWNLTESCMVGFTRKFVLFLFVVQLEKVLNVLCSGHLNFMCCAYILYERNCNFGLWLVIWCLNPLKETRNLPLPAPKNESTFAKLRHNY
jgi:hypothetical protein